MGAAADPVTYTIPTLEVQKLTKLLVHLGAGYETEASQADTSGAPLAVVRWLLARQADLEGRVERLEEERRALISRVGMLEVVAMAGLP